jgi:hypothetical protein
MSKFLWVKLSFVFFILGQSGWAAPSNKCPDLKVSTGKTDNQKLEIFMKTSWDDHMNDIPEWGYDLGYKELGDHWSDDSIAAIEVRKNKADCLKADILKII